jgi:hypothetical protein
MTRTSKSAAPAGTPERADPPQQVGTRTTPDLIGKIDVIDADTGKPMTHVIAADAEAGTVTRLATDEAGNLVRQDNCFVRITEERALRIAWRVDAGGEEA